MNPAEQGNNIGQLFFAGNGWGKESSLLDPSFTNPIIPDGGSIVEIKCPEDYPGVVNFKDWVLHIRKSE